MLIFYKFDNGIQHGFCGSDVAAATSYVEGLAMVAQHFGACLWVTGSLSNECSPDGDGWLEARKWLEQRN